MITIKKINKSEREKEILNVEREEQKMKNDVEKIVQEAKNVLAYSDLNMQYFKDIKFNNEQNEQTNQVNSPNEIIFLFIYNDNIIFNCTIFILIFLSLIKRIFSNQCSYLPWGPTYDFCVSNCMSKGRVGLWDLSGNFCTEDICRELCIKCER